MMLLAGHLRFLQEDARLRGVLLIGADHVLVTLVPLKPLAHCIVAVLEEVDVLVIGQEVSVSIHQCTLFPKRMIEPPVIRSEST